MRKGASDIIRPIVRLSKSSFFGLRNTVVTSDFPVEPGKISAPLEVPSHIEPPSYAYTGMPPNPHPKIQIYDKEEIERIRKAGKLARQMLDFTCSLAKPGISSDDIDKVVHEEIIKNGAYPAPLNYCGFPKSICSSRNEVVCHGIPDDQIFNRGDLLSFDISLYIHGMFGDNCATVYIDQNDDANATATTIDMDTDKADRPHFDISQRLIRATREAVQAGIEVCRPGGCFSHIGEAIHDVADSYKFDVVQKFCGHGVGDQLHLPPLVLHHRSPPHLRQQIEMRPGMVFTVEPILTEGHERTLTWSDGWTAATADGGRGAQFEHMVLITEDGHEILTEL